MTPEGKVKVWVKKWYKENLPGHWRVSPRGGPFGKQGCSDDVICWLGFFVAIEVKAEGEPLTDIQLKTLKDVQKSGGVAAVIRGRDAKRLETIKSIVQRKFEAMQLGFKQLGTNHDGTSAGE